MVGPDTGGVFTACRVRTTYREGTLVLVSYGTLHSPSETSGNRGNVV